MNVINLPSDSRTEEKPHKTASEDAISGAYQSLFFEMEKVRRNVKSHIIEANMLIDKCRRNTKELKSMNELSSFYIDQCKNQKKELHKIIWLDNKLAITENNFKKL